MPVFPYKTNPNADSLAKALQPNPEPKPAHKIRAHTPDMARHIRNKQAKRHIKNKVARKSRQRNR